MRVDGRSRFEYTTCERENFGIRMEKAADQKYPNTCGLGLRKPRGDGDESITEQKV